MYRAKLQNNLTGYEGTEVARQKIEDHANEIRPRGFLVSPLRLYGLGYNLRLH